MATPIPPITSLDTPIIKSIKNLRKWKYQNNPLLPNKVKTSFQIKAAIKILRNKKMKSQILIIITLQRQRSIHLFHPVFKNNSRGKNPIFKNKIA